MSPTKLHVRRRRAARTAAILAVVVTSASASCNVFVSLARCESDADCAAGSSCDPSGKFCLVGAPIEASVPDSSDDAPVEGGPDHDADAARPPCDLGRPYLAPTLVRGLEDRAISSARLTSNETTVLFSSLNGGTDESRTDLFSATRGDRLGSFGAIRTLPVVNVPLVSEYWPTLSADGKLLFFDSARSLTKQGGDYVNDVSRIWLATRVSTLADFEEPRIHSLFAIDASVGEGSPYIHPGGRSLYFTSFEREGKGSGDIFVARLTELGIPLSITNVDAVNSPESELHPVVSLDDKQLFFAREVQPDLRRDIFISTRASPDGDFGAASPIAELSTSDEDYPSWVSDDLCRIYFISDRPLPSGADAGASLIERLRLWVAERPPLP